MKSTNLVCPRCGSNHVVKNGKIHNQKPKYKCKDCGRQFVENPTKKVIDSYTKELIDKLLLERIPLAGIARVTGVSRTWLQDYVNKKYADVELQVKVSPKSKGRLTIECDELWSFVDNKQNKQWVWLAIDRDTKEIVGVYIGDRSEEGARELWKSLPPVYRQCAVCYSDFWAAYACVLPKKRHRPVGKDSGKTNHIERFNNTLRQRISRLVRSALSFSKKLENHIGAIWYFIHHYNSCIAA
ncbi:MAG TPA: IS1 family transposase [Nostocaceae cyanobacterium]|nr:IS1 family transposase [Nostocaceae cyanobacterium]